MMNLTQLVGLIAFAVAAIASARTGVLRQHRVWFAIAALLAICAVEVVCGLRHVAHNLADSALQSLGLNSSRRGVQLMLIAGAALAAGGMLLAVLMLRGFDPPARLPAMALVALLWVFMVETITLHTLDAILYAPIGPIALIAGLWVALATVIAFASWRAAVLTHKATKLRMH